MCDIDANVLDVLQRFNKRADGFDEGEVTEALRALRNQHPDQAEELREASSADSMAFHFATGGEDAPSAWGTYFAPAWSGTNEDGTDWEAPSLQAVTNSVVETWKSRCQQFTNPTMLARYADLVWDLTEKATGQNPGVEYAHMAIDAYVQIALDGRYDFLHKTFHKLRRALGLSLSINDSTRVTAAKEAILDLAAKESSTDSRAWSHAYDLLVRHPRVKLADTEEERIIKGLEDRLSICSDHARGSDGFDPFLAKDIALRLAEHYNRRSQKDDIKRALTAFESAFQPLCQQAMSLWAIPWYEWIREAYAQYGLKEDAERVLHLIHKKGETAEKDMGAVQVQQEITCEELEKVRSWLTEGSLESALAKVATSFLPEVGQEKLILQELAKKHPVLALMSISVMDQDQVVARAGSVTEDFDRRLARQMADGLNFSVSLLTVYTDMVRNHFSPTSDQLLDILYQSPLYDPDRRDLLCAAVTSYLGGEYVVAGHLLVPQIEHMLRRLLTMVGGTAWKPNRYGGYQLKNMNDILRETAVRQAMGDSLAMYLQVLLVNPLGWNIRNQIAHGLLPASAFGRQICDRLFHVLVVLGGFRSRVVSDQGDR